jgi:hypothetical protein
VSARGPASAGPLRFPFKTKDEANVSDLKNQAYIAALIEERALYQRSGLPEKAAEVTAELQRIGGEGKPAAKRAVKRAKVKDED